MPLVAAAGCADGAGTSAAAPVPTVASTAPARPPSPAPAPVVRFAVKGDWGYGGADQTRVTRRMCAERRTAPFAFVLTTGDNFYRPDGTAVAANFTRPEACLIRSGVRWRPTWGNHDLAGDGTATALGEKRHWYTFATGPLRVVVLDANDPGNPVQLRFLKRTLAAAAQPVRVVAFHQPAYTLGLHPPGETQRKLWGPVFRRYGVALVLQGHNHAYERFAVGGITYITTGGGGAPVYPCVRFSRYTRACAAEHHFLLAAADATGITVQAVRPDGSRIERVRVAARASARR
ncbi:MAG: metallophosphoesterase [Thermoleophilia bacterium]|nr:metallophosphoesterase [Thermoleophilia bacterium]